MKLLIKFPTKGRPEKFKDTFLKYLKLSRESNDYIITIDKDDKSMDFIFYDSFPDTDRSGVNVYRSVCQNKGKIHAINYFVDGLTPLHGYDVLVLVSDDMIPQVEGWDSIIKEEMEKHFPALDGVLHFNDGFKGESLNTLPIMGINYFKRFGYIYNPEYKSLFADDEFTEVAKMLSKVVYIDRVIIRHEHPMNGIGKNDELYKKNNSLFQYDQAVYNSRKLRNFDLNI